MIGGERLEVDRRRRRPTLEPRRCGARGHSPTARPTSIPTRAASSCRCAGQTRLVEVVRALDAAGVDAVDVQRREPTLDDVFLTLTGRVEPELEEVAA